MPALSPRRTKKLLDSMAQRRVLVLGDVMLDEFIWGRVARISPEAPVPVVEVTRQSFHLGGAGNVAGNVVALGGQATLVGVVGDDDAGRRVRAELEARGVQAALAVDRGTRPTTLKTRIVAHHQQVVRADRELAQDVAGDLERELLARLVMALPGCQALLVSDYQKGVVTPRVMQAVRRLAAKHRLPVLVDPKVNHQALYRQVSVVTPNQSEAEQIAGRVIKNAEDLAAVGQRLLRLLRCQAVLITRGEHGLSLFESGRRPVHVPTAAREVYDVTGAGDTVIATLALALAAGAPLGDAARLANHAAGVVVGKLGTATTSPDELLAAVQAARQA